MKEKISITIDSRLTKEIDAIIDNIYIRNRSQAIEHLVSIALGDNKTAVILAGGSKERIRIGKEYRPTIKVSGKPVVQKQVEKLRSSGFKKIHIIARQNVLSRIFNIIKNGDEFGVKVEYIEEKYAKGSAESLKAIKGKVNGDFLVVYGDLVFDKINLEELWNDHIKNNSLATIMMTTSSKPSEKGTLKVEGNKVLTFTQKPKESDIYLVFAPIFAASPEILEYSGASLEKDVFPDIASHNLLFGHLSSEKEIHIHSKNDASKL